MMKNNEFAIGEIFQFGLKKLKVVKYDNNRDLGCVDCALYGTYCRLLNGFVGECNKLKRSDKKNVIFVEVEDKQ